MIKIFVGIDNGVSGSIGIIYSDNSRIEQIPMPVKSEQNYTKKKGKISRVDFPKLKEILSKIKQDASNDTNNIILGLERPMVNPARFKASKSALRSLESTLICVEELKIPFKYLDSKEWQKKLLPKGLKGPKELKGASLDIGKRLFPNIEFDKKLKDLDGLLIAEYLKLTWWRD